MKTAEEMYPYLPNEENDIAIREYNQLMYGRREAYNEGVKAMQSSTSQPMSAEQVHGLAEKYASGYYEKDDYEYNSLTDLCIWEKLVRAFKAGAALSTAPTVKAEGWVSVEDGLPSIGEIDEGTQIMTYPHYCNCNYGKFINARTGNEEIGFYSYDGEFGGDTKLHGATHWRNRQPLPSPPTVNINK